VVDLASERDLAAKIILFGRGADCYVFGKYHLPAEAIKSGKPNYEFDRNW
jgi:hypothetical protein